MLKGFIQHSLLRDIGRLVVLHHFQRKWRSRNRHNGTFPMNRFPIDCVTVGKHSYGELNVTTFAEQTKLRIGHYVSISQNVRFLLDVEHYTDHISTFPFRVKVLKICENEAFSKGDIVVGDDAWIGFGATIMSGVQIGQGAVIAAGAVVTKDVPPYAVAGGVPAKVIRYRFDRETCESLMQMDYARLDEKTIREQETLLYRKVDPAVLEETKRYLPRERN